VAADGVQIPIRSGRQQWLVSWHPPPEPPDGTPHGAEGVCVTPGGDIVLISPDGTIWDLPAGRPEPGETWEETLRREMDEEACATVTRARLLGFTRGQCITGPERGRVLVRSAWQADVELRPWEARFEIAGRRVIAPGSVEDALSLGSHPFAAINPARACRGCGDHIGAAAADAQPGAVLPRGVSCSHAPDLNLLTSRR
jgi:ADP-ribose pyrophosphatase YjhB (NUDIX family)